MRALVVRRGRSWADVLKRINAQVGEGSEESLIQLIQSSLMISCDNAHAFHPNFRDKHDDGSMAPPLTAARLSR